MVEPDLLQLVGPHGNGLEVDVTTVRIALSVTHNKPTQRCTWDEAHGDVRDAQNVLLGCVTQRTVTNVAVPITVRL